LILGYGPASSRWGHGPPFFGVGAYSAGLFGPARAIIKRGPGDRASVRGPGLDRDRGPAFLTSFFPFFVHPPGVDLTRLMVTLGQSRPAAGRRLGGNAFLLFQYQQAATERAAGQIEMQADPRPVSRFDMFGKTGFFLFR